MKYMILCCAVLGGILLYMLSSASANTDLFSRNYYLLLMIAGAMATGLALLVAYQVWQLRAKLHEQVYGAKLTLRLAIFFSMIAVLPGVLVYAVSVQFLGKSIESWFDVRVEKALEGGLNLARSTFQNGMDDLNKKAYFAAQLLIHQDAKQRAETLTRFIDEAGIREAHIFDRKGKLLVQAGKHHNAQVEAPSPAMLHEAWQRGKYGAVEAQPDESLNFRILVPIRSRDITEEQLLVQLLQPVPKQLASDAETVQAVYGDYQQLSLSRLGLKRLYGITLTLSLLIVLLSAISAAFYLSARLSAPLAALAAGTRAVAKGDFSSSYPVQSRDELGALTGLFNQMTAQLAAAKKLSEQQQRQVVNAKTYLESVLAHLSSGVLVVDEKFQLRSANASSSNILGIPLNELQGKRLVELSEANILLRTFFEEIQTGLSTEHAAAWQRQIERKSKHGDQVLLLSGTSLMTESEKSYVVVFDDITHLLQAERQAAWGEVARRLAHEIKNPLTPIQLSAERLQHKLLAKLDEQDAQLLQRATQTIVSQVGAMKNMVSEFANYARAPAARMIDTDMHQLLSEVMGLYEANSSPIALNLEAKKTVVKGDATRLRQVIHNLLQNAHDALQQTEQPQITLATENSANDEFKLMVRDNGSGIPEHLLGRLFEPYMTTKKKGTGLGLAIVKKIVEEHGGKINIASQHSGGTSVAVFLPLAPKEAEEV